MQKIKLNWNEKKMMNKTPYLFLTGLLFSSGLGTTSAITHLLNAGDQLVAMDDLYGGTYFFKGVGHGRIIDLRTYF